MASATTTTRAALSATENPKGHSLGAWIPKDHASTVDFVNVRVKQVKANPKPKAKVIKDFETHVHTDPALHGLLTQMLTQVPAKHANGPGAKPDVPDVETLTQLLNHAISEPPSWHGSAPVAAPLSTILDWSMRTAAGRAAFLNPRVNQHVQNMHTAWSQYLHTQDSCSTLTTDDNGWFSQSAMEHPSMKNFESDFICDPSKKHYGFTSWDHFFTRELRPGARPVESPHDDGHIASPCESSPVTVQTGLQMNDKVQIKGHSYSLADLVSNHPDGGSFAGGTMSQGYVYPSNYHRFHAPVSGKLLSKTIVPGKYFTEASPGDSKSETDSELPGYIPAIPTRGEMFIKADNPAIGIIGLIMVGMAEGSSVEITQPVGAHFRKGDQLGMFHYGGSTHCLVFRPGVDLKWNGATADPSSASTDGSTVLLNSSIATLPGPS